MIIKNRNQWDRKLIYQMFSLSLIFEHPEKDKSRQKVSKIFSVTEIRATFYDWMETLSTLIHTAYFSTDRL